MFKVNTKTAGVIVDAFKPANYSGKKRDTTPMFSQFKRVELLCLVYFICF